MCDIKRRDAEHIGEIEIDVHYLPNIVAVCFPALLYQRRGIKLRSDVLVALKNNGKIRVSQTAFDCHSRRSGPASVRNSNVCIAVKDLCAI